VASADQRLGRLPRIDICIGPDSDEIRLISSMLVFSGLRDG
jgi:hypothetical protein